jgi:hypothetical protein
VAGTSFDLRIHCLSGSTIRRVRGRPAAGNGTHLADARLSLEGADSWLCPEEKDSRSFPLPEDSLPSYPADPAREDSCFFSLAVEFCSSS